MATPSWRLSTVRAWCSWRWAVAMSFTVLSPNCRRFCWPGRVALRRAACRSPLWLETIPLATTSQACFHSPLLRCALTFSFDWTYCFQVASKAGASLNNFLVELNANWDVQNRSVRYVVVKSSNHARSGAPTRTTPSGATEGTASTMEAASFCVMILRSPSRFASWSAILCSAWAIMLRPRSP